MLKLGLLVSGRLGAICLKKIYPHYTIEFVFTNTLSKEIVLFCNKNNIPVFIGNPTSNSFLKAVENKKIEVLFSINYLFIIDEALIKLPSKYAINIHGSLLPKYRGRTPHIWSIINNEQFTGITVHKMVKEVDAGAIAEQVKIPIATTDTGGKVLKKFEKLYPKLILKTLSKVKKKTIYFKAQNESTATYFEKRTPEDGLINWNWQKEQVYNWIRALSKPYPGAFSFYKKTKVVIHALRFSDMGYLYSMKNGLILKVTTKSLFIKTSNGVVELYKIENFNTFLFKSGEVLSNEFNKN